MCVFATQAGGELRQFPAQAETGPAAGLAHHLQVTPGDPLSPASSYGLHSGLFGGKAGGQTFCGIRPGSTVADFFRGKDAGEEALAKALHGSPDPGHFSYVNSCAYNHLGLIKVP
jgi:hypothetical protein